MRRTLRLLSDSSKMASLLQTAETAVLSKIPGADPRPAQKAQAFSGMNDGPAVTASRLTGLTQKDVARDDASLYTSAFGGSLLWNCPLISRRW